jgi:hypothetical protein
MPEVLNAWKVGQDCPGAVYVGRPSVWGNPFIIGKDGAREEVIEKYRVWLPTQAGLMRNLKRLRGKDLICWCSPQPCHADVLLEFANREGD